jgi:hypothetical protein
MDEDLLAVIHRKEAVALFGAKPFHNADSHSPENLLRRSSIVPAARKWPPGPIARGNGAYNTWVVKYKMVG